MALSHFLAQEFPHLGGPKVRELFVAEVVRLVEQFYPTLSGCGLVKRFG